MLLILKLTWSLLLPQILGMAALRLILRNQKLHLPFSLAIGHGLGMGLFAQCMLLMGILNIRYSVFTISLFTIVCIFLICAYLQVLKSKKGPQAARFDTLEENSSILKGASFTQKLLIGVSILYIAYYVTFIFWKALNLPVYTWDSIATSIYNAKVIYYENSLSKLEKFIHPSYPLHIQFLSSWISFNLGEWSDQWIKIIYPLIFSSFAVIYFTYLKIATNQKWALLGLVMLFSSNLIIYHATIAYRDMYLMYYSCCAVLFLLLWQKLKDTGFLLLSSFFAGFATFIKNEGVAYLAIYVLLVLFILKKDKDKPFKKGLKQSIKFLIPCVVIFLHFFIYKMFIDIPTSQFGEYGWGAINAVILMNRSIFILTTFYTTLFFSANWNILWLFLLVSLLLNYNKIKEDLAIQVFLITLFMFFGIHGLLSLLSNIGAGIVSPYTISRLIIHYFPICIILIILLNYRGLKGCESFR